MSQKPDYSQFKLFQQFFPDLIYRDPFDLLPPHLFPNILIKGNSAGEVLKSLCKSVVVLICLTQSPAIIFN